MNNYRKKIKDNIGLAYFLNLSFKEASGCKFKDFDDKEYIDLTSGYGVANIGWQHKEMLKFQIELVNRINYAPPWCITREALELSEKLLSYLPENEYKCIRATGGANANEIALSIFTNLTDGDIGTFKKSYHGWSQATIGISEEEFKFPKVNKYYKSIKIDFPNEDYSEESILKIFEDNPTIKIFIAEPILGSGGVFIPDKKFWELFHKICKQKNVYLIFDESITGFGRVGEMFAFKYFNVCPDAIILAKGISSGYSAIGTCLVRKNLIEKYNFADISASFSWTPYSCSIASKNIEIIEKENLVKNSYEIGCYFKSKINEIFFHYLKSKDINFDIRGQGLMIGISVFKDNKPDINFIARMLFFLLKNGVMTSTSWDNSSLVLLPPLIIDKNICNQVLDIIELFLKKYLDINS